MLRKKFMSDVGFAGHGKRKDVLHASIRICSQRSWRGWDEE